MTQVNMYIKLISVVREFDFRIFSEFREQREQTITMVCHGNERSQLNPTPNF